MCSSSLGRSVAKLPSSTEGPLAPTTTQSSVMAGSSPAVVMATSGPVPADSAPSRPAPSVPQDSALPLDDLPPPPPPAEPYEVFMARVRRDLSSLPVGPPQSGAAVPPRAAVPTPTTGSRLPTPFPRFEDSSWALQPQAPNTRIRMPLPASCYVMPPSPWVWPGRGSAVATTMVRGPLPATLPAGPSGPSGPSGHLAGPSTVGPSPVPPPTTPAVDPKMTSPTPLRFRGFFSGATAPFVPTAPSSRVNTVAPTLTQQDAGTIPQGPAPEMIKGWKEEFMVDMRVFWQQFVGDAPPQPTVGPSVTPENMGPNSLSPSDDREASRAQHKTGSKRAGSSIRRRSRSIERSSTDRHRARVRRPPASPDSSSPTRRLSPPAKRSRWDQREISNDSSSSEGGQRSTRPRRPWRSRSPLPRRRGLSSSTSPHRRYRNSPAPSRCPSGANMTRRPAGRPSLSPRRRSSSHHRRSRGRQSSPPSRSRDPHRRMTLSSSRSPSPKRHRNYSTSPRRHGSRSSSPERVSHPYDSDIRLLRLCADDDDQRPVSTHPRDSPDPEQSTPVDGSQLSAEKVQKLFADLITPPALSHYADPIPDSAPNNQLVPYVRTSASTATTVNNSEPLETHGLFQNYQSFHRLSGEGGMYGCVSWSH